MNGFGITWVSRKDWGSSALRIQGLSFDEARAPQRRAKPNRGLTQFDKVIPFDDYLRNVVATRGELEARAGFFSK